MRGLLGRYLSQAVDVPVEDQFVCMDADTEKDLSRLKEEFLKQSLAKDRKNNVDM